MFECKVLAPIISFILGGTKVAGRPLGGNRAELASGFSITVLSGLLQQDQTIPGVDT